MFDDLFQSDEDKALSHLRRLGWVRRWIGSKWWWVPPGNPTQDKWLAHEAAVKTARIMIGEESER
jgi:hypothetical protein